MPNKLIYADNAATTNIDADALRILIEESHFFYNPSQTYSAGVQERRKLDSSRKMIARCINAEPDEIFFTSGGTESDNWALKCITPQPGRNEIVISSIEHPAILNTCKAIGLQNKKITYVFPNQEGIIEPSRLQGVIRPSVYIVSIMHTNNEIGTIQPIKELAKIAHRNGAFFHSDAVQAVGHLAIDVKDLDVDLLSASAHKFNGPKGVGFLYIKEGTPITALLHGGSQQKSYRAGTENTPSIMAMATALEKRCMKLDDERERILKLESAFIFELQRKMIPFHINGSQEQHQPGIMNISFPPIPGEIMMHRLDLKGICVSTGSACNASHTEISHVLRSLQMDETIAKCAIRISLDSNNTMTDIHEIVDAICVIYKQMSIL